MQHSNRSAEQGGTKMTLADAVSKVGNVSRRRMSVRARAWDTLRLVLSSGGPGRCEFALTNACNANCGFCNFARDSLPKDRWEYVERKGALEAIDILFHQDIRYLILTGGEPTLHPDLTELIGYATAKGMKVMMVSNGALLKPHKLREYI